MIALRTVFLLAFSHRPRNRPNQIIESVPRPPELPSSRTARRTGERSGESSVRRTAPSSSGSPWPVLGLAKLDPGDPWGKRRFPTGADDPTGSIASQTTRGFTGHEMIDEIGLVNMNGRVYDP